MARPAKDKPRKCLLCGGSARLVSLAVRAYVKGQQGISGTMVICETCLTSESLSKRAALIGEQLRDASLGIYMRLRGVS